MLRVVKKKQSKYNVTYVIWKALVSSPSSPLAMCDFNTCQAWIDCLLFNDPFKRYIVDVALDDGFKVPSNDWWAWNGDMKISGNREPEYCVHMQCGIYLLVGVGKIMRVSFAQNAILLIRCIISNAILC